MSSKTLRDILNIPDEGISEPKQELISKTITSNLWRESAVFHTVLVMWVLAFLLSIGAVVKLIDVRQEFYDLMKQILGGSITLGIGFLLGKKD